MLYLFNFQELIFIFLHDHHCALPIIIVSHSLTLSSSTFSSSICNIIKLCVIGIKDKEIDKVNKRKLCYASILFTI